LLAQTVDSYDLIVARLDSQSDEQVVQGYAQVILAQLYSGAATKNMASNAASDVVSLTSAPTPFGCEQLSVDDAALVVGSPVVGQAVANAEGVGCRFEADAEDGSIDPTLFSGDFATYGLLAGVIPLAEGQGWLDAVVSELADSSTVVEEQTIEDLLDLIYSDEYHQAVGQITAIDWQSESWSVETLADVEGDTLLLYDEFEGETTFYLWRPHPDGGLYFLTAVSSLLMDDLRPALVDALHKLMADAAAGASSTEQPTNTDEQPNRAAETQADPAPVELAFAPCDLLSLGEAVGVAGDYLVAQPVANEKGSGCKYAAGIPEPTIDPTDFTDQFDQVGLLLGVLTPARSQ